MALKHETDNPDRHDGYKWLRVDAPVAALMEELARKKRTNFTRLSNLILKMFAEGVKKGESSAPKAAPTSQLNKPPVAK